ncbi:MAG: 50S ribosomal protein L29 [Candidatus Magasanikbacteria bacterium]|nr:50S ribosomal protein L29 [Candidatus Magasanikbacteria bacterium]
MEFEDLQYKTEKELRDLLHEKRELVRELYFKASERQLKDPSKIKQAKKTVARILTMLKMRQRGEQKQKKVIETNKENNEKDKK